MALRSTLHQDNDLIRTEIVESSLFDATQHARDLAVAPFLDQGLHQFFLGTGMGGESPSRLIALFVARTSYLYVLPPQVALQLLQAIMAYTCTMQAVLGVAAVYYWRRPIVVAVPGHPEAGAPNPGSATATDGAGADGTTTGGVESKKND
jgi:hypothetical protein